MISTSGIALAEIAEADLADHLDYYERRGGSAIADLFLADLERAFQRLRHNPRLGSRVHGEHRRWLLENFPISVLYRVEAEAIIVLGLPHQRRRPRA